MDDYSTGLAIGYRGELTYRFSDLGPCDARLRTKVGRSGDTTGVRLGSGNLRSLYRLSLVTVMAEIFLQAMEVDRSQSLGRIILRWNPWGLERSSHRTGLVDKQKISPGYNLPFH